VQAILEAPDEDTAPKAMSVLETGFYNAAAVLLLPEKYRERLPTTSSIERLNEEIRRRERGIHIFPNRESVISLARCSVHGKGREMDYMQEIL
jgi:transposase-like protein